MPEDFRPPYRIQFDNARDPYSARNALGITGTGGSGGGLITSVSPPLSVTGGNLTVDLSGLQPLDADLTSLAAASATDAIYYRSAANTWGPVTIGAGLTFTGGTLNSASGGAGSFVLKAGDTMTGPLVMPSTGTAPAASITFGTANTGLFGGVNSISMTTSGTARMQMTTSLISLTLPVGVPGGTASATGLNFGTAGTGFFGGTSAIALSISNAARATLNATNLTMTVPVVLPANPTNNLEAATKQYVDGFQPLDADLTSLAAASATNAIYYRSAANTWATVTVGTGLTFSAGTLAASAAAGGFTSVVIQKFTSSGTYTPTAGMKFCIVECVGGGGGGGAATATAGSTFQGGGGGGGSYSRSRLTAAQIGASQTVTIGGAGAGNTGTGGAGSGTSVGVLITTAGGAGGQLASSGSNPNGGAGGAAGTGDVAIPGTPGGFGQFNFSNPQIYALSGNGGAGPLGGGAVTVFASVGTNASLYGAGGAGGHSHTTTSNFAGGYGSAGIVIITEFI